MTQLTRLRAGLAILIISFFATACASTSAPIDYRTVSPGAARGAAPSVRSAHIPAPAFEPAYDLKPCQSGISNAGAVDASGRVATFTPYVTVQSVILARNPTENACLSSGFGWRDLAANGGRPHNGADFARPRGAAIYAAGAGRVISAGRLGEFGNTIELDHGGGVRTLYAHLSEIAPFVIAGAVIPAGAAIGRMGDTGNATGVHLHYEISVRGNRIDPLGPGDGTIASAIPVFGSASGSSDLTARAR